MYTVGITYTCTVHVAANVGIKDAVRLKMTVYVYHIHVHVVIAGNRNRHEVT